MQKYGRFFFFSMCCFALLTSQSGCQREEPVRIGFMAGLTGRVADLGVPGRNGALLAIEEVNAAGGINHRPVELLVRNDAQNPDVARQMVTDLVDSGVEVIIGPMTSNIAMATVPLVNASRTILLSPTVTTTELAGKDDHFLRVIATTATYAEKCARFAYENRGYRKIVAIYEEENRAYTVSWLDNFRNSFAPLGGNVVMSLPFHSGDNVGFSQLSRDLLDLKPDAVLIIANAVDAAMIAQQIHKHKQAMPIIMSEWAATEHFIKLAGGAAEGVVVSQFLDRSNNSVRYQTFLKNYRNRFGQEPGFAGVAGYDSARITLEGLSRRSPGKSLQESILEIRSFPCLQQVITFDRFGDADRKTFIAIIRHGQYITLE